MLVTGRAGVRTVEMKRKRLDDRVLRAKREKERRVGQGKASEGRATTQSHVWWQTKPNFPRGGFIRVFSRSTVFYSSPPRRCSMCPRSCSSFTG